MKKSKITKIVAMVTAVFSCMGTFTAYATDETNTQQVHLPKEVLTNVATEDFQCYEIDQSIADEVNHEFTRQEKKTPLTSSSVGQRDWTVFDDEYCLSVMTDAEQEFYHRLENTSVDYIANDILDATQPFKNYGYQQYMTKGTLYSDLGLSTDEAKTITQWFINNNAQYYFYSRQIIYSSREMYMVFYDSMADGEKRAEITNQMFTTIDSWLNTVQSNNKGTYQKIETANDLICDEVSYNFNDYDQSIYSAVQLRETVCAGYSRLMAILMNGSGVPSSILTGNNHAWNSVRFDDGKYYGVDVTWNDSLGKRRLFGCSNENMKQYDTQGEHTRKSDYARFEPAGEDKDYDPNAVLSAPKISVSPVTETSEKIDWNTVDGATNYRIEIATDNTFKNIVASKTTTATTFTATKLTPNTSYYTRVRAFYTNTDGQRVYSAFGKKSFLTIVTLAKPTVTLTLVDTSFKATWKKINNATHYSCLIATDKKFKNVVVNKTTGAKSFTPTNLESGKTYYVKVRAFVIRPNGNRIYSPYSEIVSIKV